MKRIITIAVAVSIFSLLNTAKGQDQAKPAEAKTLAQDRVELPESKTLAVFTMKYSGGLLRPGAKDAARPPFLQVFADGRVVTPPDPPEEQAYEFQLQPEQLQFFLKQVVYKNQFYELDTEKIQQEIAAAGPIAKIADAPTLEILMELPRGAHAISAFTPKSTAKQLQDVKSIKQVANIEDLGRELSLIATAGGYKNVEHALSKVNEQLKEKGLDVMTINDLYACKKKDGNLAIIFNRKYYMANGQWRDWINAKVTVDGDQENVEIKTNIGDRREKVAPEKKQPESNKQKVAAKR